MNPFHPRQLPALICFGIALLLLTQPTDLWAQTERVSPDTLPPATPSDSLITDQFPAADTLLQDSLRAETIGAIKRFFTKNYPSPRKALIFSLVLPGAGQVYNKSWWKLPFVYGALGGMAYLVDLNSSEYLSYKRAYRRAVRGLPHDFTGTRLASASTLKEFRDRANKNRQRSYFGLFAVYGLVGMEAFVDAHLDSFDVSDDLTLRLRPNLDASPVGTPVMGIGLQLQFQ